MGLGGPLGETVRPTDHWLSLQAWSAASISPASWSTPRPFTTLATRAGPGAASPLRRPPRWTCWTGLRQSTPRRCPEVRVDAATECPGRARMGLGCPFLFAGLRFPWLCSHLFLLKPASNTCALPRVQGSSWHFTL